MNPKELQSFLDFKAQQYESIDFIAHDPIQIPHRFSQKKDIEIGKRNFGKVSVTSGLNEGDIVISEGVSKVRDKGKIKIITQAK